MKLTHRNFQDNHNTNPANLSTQDKARWLMVEQNRSRKNRQLSMLNRTAAEVGL
jgi:hypothetical protein